MSVRMCQHVKVDGTLCQVPPLDGRQYCHFHLEHYGRRMRMARARARRETYHLVLPILEDLNSVLVARQQVMDALNAGLIDAKHAGVLLYGLQGIASDLRSDKAPRLGVYDPAIDTAPRATEYVNFEANYDLPPDLDLSQPPEVVAAEVATAMPAAESRSEAERSLYRSNPWQDVQPEDVALEEALIADGQEAHDKLSAEFSRKEWKRIDKEKDKIAAARHIVEAARRNQRQFSSNRLKRHYEKLWAEAAAKEKADQEELAALRARAMAAAEARTSAAGAPGASDASPAMGEAGKKPSATVSQAEIDEDRAKRAELSREVEALSRRLGARG